ncbi:hypothetical protein QTP86_023741 [Hemibagrus guttatus]|nr:hypothetical protein QTP86_023741 [Hemibagrus guttatus]
MKPYCCSQISTTFLNLASTTLSHSFIAQGEGAVRVCLKERGQDVLVLQRVASDRASPQTAGGVKEDDGDRRLGQSCWSRAVCTWSSANAQGESLIFPLEHDGVTQSFTEMQNLKPVTLVQQEEDDDDDGDDDDEDDEGSESECSSSSAGFKAFDITRFRYIDDEDHEDHEDEDDEDDVFSNRDASSSLCSGCSTEDDYQSDSSSSAVFDRYVVVSGTPHKILEHLLSDLRLDEHQGATEGKEADFSMFWSLIQYVLTYCTKRCRGKEEGKEALYRKRKVLHLVSQWSSLYKDFLREEEHVKLFMKQITIKIVYTVKKEKRLTAKHIDLWDVFNQCNDMNDFLATLYRYVLEDVYEFPTLEKDLKEFQKLLRRRHTVDDYSPHQKNKALFQQLSLRENGVQLRGAHSDHREVMCHVYMSSDSYLSVRVRTTVVAQELLHVVAQRMEKPVEDMVLVAQTYSGEKRVLQPHDCLFSESLALPGRLMACWRDLNEILPPLTDCVELAQRPSRLLGINTWDVSVALTNLDWSLFNSVHEQELVYYTFSRQASSGHTVALEQLLQRCNEVQQWVMSEVLLCPSLGKRVQLLKKFIKIAAHCKAQRNLNSSFAIIMGLNTAAVSRLNQTWEKVPGKFKKLFSELELLTDPSLNHKAYRDAFRKMKPPKIPFMPLLLKDITFIHEGNKTFHDNLVNFEKLHMIADTVRLIRHCQTEQTGSEVAQSDSADMRSSVHYLHIIDNQQTLFELSHRLEPRA